MGGSTFGQSCGGTAAALVDCQMLLPREIPKLAAFVEAWDGLPAAIRAAVL